MSNLRVQEGLGADLLVRVKSEPTNPVEPVFASDVEAMREFLRNNPDEPPAKKARAESD